MSKRSASSAYTTSSDLVASVRPPSGADRRTSPQANVESGQHDPEQLEQLLSERQAAAYLNVAAKTLQNWRWRGDGPPFIKLGGGKLVRYRASDLVAFVEHGLRASTSDAGARS